MKVIVFFAIIILINEFIQIIKGNVAEINVKMIYGSLIVLVCYFAFFAYPSAKPLGTYSVVTEVKTNSDKYSLKVDFIIQEADEDYSANGESKWTSVRVYKPAVIYWPNSGYTALNPDYTDYSKEAKKYVHATGYNENEEYEIYIPKIEFSPSDKLLSMGWDLLFYLVPMIIGTVALIFLARNKKEKQDGVQ